MSVKQPLLRHTDSEINEIIFDDGKRSFEDSGAETSEPVETHRRAQSDQIKALNFAAFTEPKFATYTYQDSGIEAKSHSWTNVLGESRSKNGKLDFELRERGGSTVNSNASTGSSGRSTVHAYQRRPESPMKHTHRQQAHTYTLVHNKPKRKQVWDDLVNLDIHKRHGLITDQQYRESKAQLGGTQLAPDAKPRRSLSKKAVKDREVLFQGMKFIKEQPEWALIRTQKVIRYKYNPRSEKWESDEKMVQISTNPFAYGSQRMCFYLRDSDEDPDNECKYVAKKISPIIEDRESYFKDVAMQTHAQTFADLFNQCRVTKKVAFLDCWVYEFVEMQVCEHYEPPSFPCMAVEPLLEGEYRKYNNNMDWIESTLARNTPQAFSHFTYEVSGEQILICDVQGVNDIYTDPQFHTALGIQDTRFGSGNLGKVGFDSFFAKHVCNSICQYLKLKRRNKTHPNLLDGTKTNTRFMQKDSVATYNASGSHMKSLPRPGGQVTYDATRDFRQHESLPPLLPGFKAKKEDPNDNKYCCCSIL